jgi:hypothetical protein
LTDEIEITRREDKPKKTNTSSRKVKSAAKPAKVAKTEPAASTAETKE